MYIAANFNPVLYFGRWTLAAFGEQQDIGKKVRSYITRYPVLGTVQGAFHFTLWQTCSYQRNLDLSVKHTAMLQLLREDYSFTCLPPGTQL